MMLFYDEFLKQIDIMHIIGEWDVRRYYVINPGMGPRSIGILSNSSKPK